MRRQQDLDTGISFQRPEKKEMFSPVGWGEQREPQQATQDLHDPREDAREDARA
jgi:hypothetical protein